MNPSSLSLDEAVRLFVRRVKEELPNIKLLTERDLAVVLLTYRYVIEPRFIPWLLIAEERAESHTAKLACGGNISCETGDNPQKLSHQKMLHNFVAPIVGRYMVDVTLLDLCCASAERMLIWARRSSRRMLLIMALLENASTVFISWMKQASNRLRLTDQTYLEVHGSADIEHAQEFIQAVKAENGNNDDCYDEDQDTFDYVAVLLNNIFHSYT